MQKETPLGRYRSSYAFFAYLMVVIIGFGLGWGVVRMFQGRSNLEEALLAVAILSPILGVFTFVVLTFYVTEIYDWGLRTYDGFGIYHKVRWDQMNRVRKLNFGFGFKYLLVSLDKRPLFLGAWVPLFLDNMDDFRQKVARLAPPDSSLLRHL